MSVHNRRVLLLIGFLLIMLMMLRADRSATAAQPTAVVTAAPDLPLFFSANNGVSYSEGDVYSSQSRIQTRLVAFRTYA